MFSLKVLKDGAADCSWVVVCAVKLTSGALDTVDLSVLGPGSGALWGYGFADFLFGRGGGTCSPVLFFMTFRKCFCAWLRIYVWRIAVRNKIGCKSVIVVRDGFFLPFHRMALGILPFHVART